MSSLETSDMIWQFLPASLCCSALLIGPGSCSLTHNGWYGGSCWAPRPLACPLTFSRSSIYSRGRWGECPWQPKWSLCCPCAACCFCWACPLQVRWRVTGFLGNIFGLLCRWMILRELFKRLCCVKWKCWPTSVRQLHVSRVRELCCVAEGWL